MQPCKKNTTDLDPLRVLPLLVEASTEHEAVQVGDAVAQLVERAKPQIGLWRLGRLETQFAHRSRLCVGHLVVQNG